MTAVLGQLRFDRLVLHRVSYSSTCDFGLQIAEERVVEFFAGSAGVYVGIEERGAETISQCFQPVMPDIRRADQSAIWRDKDAEEPVQGTDKVQRAGAVGQLLGGAGLQHGGLELAATLLGRQRPTELHLDRGDPLPSPGLDLGPAGRVVPAQPLRHAGIAHQADQDLPLLEPLVNVDGPRAHRAPDEIRVALGDRVPQAA